MPALIGSWEHSDDVGGFNLEVEAGFAPTLLRLEDLTLSAGSTAALFIGGRGFEIDLDYVNQAGAMCVGTNGRAMGVRVNALSGAVFTGGSAHVWGVPATADDDDDDDDGGDGDAVTADHWFLAISDPNPANCYELDEIEFLDADGNPISTIGGTAFEGGAGSVNDPASRAFDGTSGGANVWFRNTSGAVFIGMAFPSPVAVTGVRLKASNPERAPRVWELRHSATTVSSVSDGTVLFSANSHFWVHGEQRTFPEDFAPGFSRAWRLLVKTVNGGSLTILNGLQFRASVGGSNQVPTLSDNFNNAAGRPIGSLITSGNEEGYRAWDGNDGTYWDDYTGNTGKWIGVAIPGSVGISVGEVALTAGAFTTHSPRNTALELWDEATAAWTQQGSDYDWGNWTTTATRTHSF